MGCLGSGRLVTVAMAILALLAAGSGDSAAAQERPSPAVEVAVGWAGFADTGTFTSSEGALTAGGGVRAVLGDRVIIGVDARLGWEPHVRVNGVVGVRLGP